MRELSYREAAEQLNVSPATVKNWTRQGILPSADSPGLRESDIIGLKKKLTLNKTLRLTSRANKSAGEKRFNPTEYMENKICRKSLNILSYNLKSINAELPELLFALSLYLIKQAGLIDQSSCEKELPHINHKNLSEEMALWYRELGSPSYRGLLDFFSRISIPLQRDTSGLIYQMLQKEGRKSEKGSYYTPHCYADEVLNQYGKKGQKFLDPCCGSGIFLLAAAQKYNSPENIYGWDTDLTAVHLARINLMLHFKEKDFIPHVYNKNSLIETSSERFDLIATNPPWGHHFTKRDEKILRKKYKNIRTGESFSYFIEKGVQLLNKDGVMSFLLPEALLKVKTHSDIREVLLNTVHIPYIKFLEKPFYRVQTKVIRLDMTVNKNKSRTTVFRDNKIYSVNCDRFINNSFFLFDFYCNKKDSRIINKTYFREYITLKNNALWILGIVSGNNSKYISQFKKEGYLPFISGKDLKPCQIDEPRQYIYFNRDVLQQCARKEFYSKSPKIVYKFITDKPVFAIDRKSYVTLNSANSFYPKPHISVESITALFNSDLYRFICKKRFNSIKVLRNQLEQLPIPQFTDDENSQLRKIVIKIEQSKEEDIGFLLNKINEFVFLYFNITDRDKKYVLENL